MRRREFKNVRPLEEMVAEFAYSRRPAAGPIGWWCCARTWGSTRERCCCSRSTATSSTSPTTASSPADEVVFEANERCDQENLIAQLKGGVRAMRMPVDSLVSNWAYMVMASLAWTLKAWLALVLPEEPGHAAEHQAEKRSVLRMEFGTFRTAFASAVPGGAKGAAVGVPAAVVEPVARGVPAAGGAAAGMLVVLTGRR